MPSAPLRTPEPTQNRLQKLDPPAGHPGKQGIRDRAGAGLGVGAERAARWPGGYRTSFWGAGAGQRCRLTPSGRNSFPCSVSSVGTWPPGLQRSGAPTPTLVLRAVGVCALTPGHALPRAWKGTLRGQNRAPQRGPSGPDEVPVLGAPASPSRPGPLLGFSSAWWLAFSTCPQASGVTRERHSLCRTRSRSVRPPWWASTLAMCLKASPLLPATPVCFLTRVLVVSPKHVWSLSHSSTSCGPSASVAADLIAMATPTPRLTRPCLFRAPPLLCLHPLTILRAQRRGLPRPRNKMSSWL